LKGKSLLLRHTAIENQSVNNQNCRPHTGIVQVSRSDRSQNPTVLHEGVCVISDVTWIYVVSVQLKLGSLRLSGLRNDLGTGEGTIARYGLICRKY
jgi:hypothetical protein